MRWKTASAAILWSLASTSHAQSSVTFYGIVDTSLEYMSKTFSSTGNAGKQFSMLDSGLSPSLFGLSGTEDLGGGLKAEFKLESGISVATGGLSNSNGNLFGRQAYVGLKGAFGEVKAGLQFSPLFLALGELDPRGLSNFGSSIGIYANNVDATGIFNSNAISYTSPVFGGFQGRAMIALGGEAGNFQAGRQYSAGLKYDNGTLMVSATFYDGNVGGTVNTVPPTNVGFQGRMLGASYKFGKLTAKASFVNYKVTGGFNNNVYGGGLDYMVLPYLDINGGVWYVSDRDATTNHSLLASLGTEYFVSRSTTLYAQVGLVSNHGAMNTSLNLTPVPLAATGTTTGLVFGIRHIF